MLECLMTLWRHCASARWHNSHRHSLRRQRQRFLRFPATHLWRLVGFTHYYYRKPSASSGCGLPFWLLARSPITLPFPSSGLVTLNIKLWDIFWIFACSPLSKRPWLETFFNYTFLVSIERHFPPFGWNCFWALGDFNSGTGESRPPIYGSSIACKKYCFWFQLISGYDVLMTYYIHEGKYNLFDETIYV